LLHTDDCFFHFALAARKRFSLDNDDALRLIHAHTRALRIVGPAYGFFGLGLSLYFASQGAGRLFWPLFGGMLRLVIAVGGGWIAYASTHSLATVFAALTAGLVIYGLVVATAIARGAWFRPRGNQGPE
jgi:Na+-driven multidrug efflux pump